MQPGRTARFPRVLCDGATPIGVVNGLDGLYGITRHGGANRSGTLYTTAGGYQVLHSFLSYYPEGTPNSLTQTRQAICTARPVLSIIADTPTYGLSNVPAKLDPVSLADISGTEAVSSWISTDALGNVYGTTDVGGQYFRVTHSS